jgi:SAM-dependent methyltransferase
MYQSKNSPSTFSTTHDNDWIGGGTGTLQRSTTSEHAPHTTTTTTSKSSAIPDYLKRHYWWAYMNPTMISILDREWLVDIVLWGNFSNLRSAALDELLTTTKNGTDESNLSTTSMIRGKTIQISCVYANLTEELLQKLAPDATLDVVDVIPAQLSNLQDKLLQRKIRNIESLDEEKVTLACCDASNLRPFYPNNSFDNVLIFFLLHETPENVRHEVVSEACRVLKTNGKLVIIDYHKPTTFLWQCIMSCIYFIYEPFAMDLWKRPLFDWLPPSCQMRQVRLETYFGGLFQKVVATKVAG